MSKSIKELETQLKGVTEERDYWEKKFVTLELKRASCCSDNEQRADKAEGQLAQLRRVIQDLMEVAFDGPTIPVGSGCAETMNQWRARIEKQSRQALTETTPPTRKCNQSGCPNPATCGGDGGPYCGAHCGNQGCADKLS